MKQLTIGNKTFANRFFLGTGKFASSEQTRAALAASETELVTVALTRVHEGDSSGDDILKAIDRTKVEVMLNTSGARNAEEAVRIAKIGKAAGFRVLGCAFLLGLGPWRREAASLAAHAFHLMRECYEAKVQFAFPRICRVDGGFVPPCEVDDEDLEQMMLAFRIVFPQCCMTVSTREAPAFRDWIVLAAADNMSAGSRVTPGGYAVLEKAHAADVAQFTLSDSRPPAEVFAAIRANGQEVVFKNWDNRI